VCPEPPGVPLSYAVRKKLYKKIGTIRQSRVLAFVTGDRRGLEAQIGSDALDLFGELLDGYKDAKLSLVLYTRGGDTLAAWSLVNLLREFCHELEIIVPSKCHSAGTLMCLGADNVIMTKQATLGPIDPSVNTPLNPPVPGGTAAARLPLSVEDIAGFIDMARQEADIKGEEYLTRVFTQLAEHVHPLALGKANRARKQIQDLARKLLWLHMDKEKDAARVEKIVNVLSSEAGSHDYTIYRTEARQSLEMKIESPNDEFYSVIRPMYADLRAELMLNEPFNPASILQGMPEMGEQKLVQYEFTRALIETDNDGGYGFLRRGAMTAQLTAEGLAVGDLPALDGWRRFDKDGNYNE
jgi:hypothetical protein